MDLAEKGERDDEPTVVTRLLDELREERERTKTSLVTAGTGARRLGFSLRRNASSQGLRAITGGKAGT